MDVHEAQRRIQALTPDQLDVVIACVHGWCPEAIESALAIEAGTRPAQAGTPAAVSA